MSTSAECAPVSLGETATGLVQWEAGRHEVLVKLEGTLPTGSFKDRGMTTLVTHLHACGARQVTIDSSGNAGASLAAYCTRAGIQCEVHVPETASSAKLVQLYAYGANIVRVAGPRAACTESALAAASHDGVLYASHAWSPLFLVGARTFAFEVVEQLNNRVPDAVVVPTGAGTLYLGAHYGFRALRACGQTDVVPRLYGIQSVACAPLAVAFADGADTIAAIEPISGVAEGVMTNRPPRGEEILRAARENGGEIVAVNDATLWTALQKLSRSGLFVEPTSALCLAGYLTLRDRQAIHSDELVVLAATGTGLKATDAIGRGLAVQEAL